MSSAAVVIGALRANLMFYFSTVVQLAECKTWDRRVMSLRLSMGTVSCPLAGHFIFCRVLVQPRKTEKVPTYLKIVDWFVKHQHNNVLLLIIIEN